MSNLLEQASLVMIPSGYKEDVVYSEIPLDGSGDLSFTRASNGTRINSQGLVEVCPWNFVAQSENIGTSPWLLNGATLTSGQTDPSGGTTAVKVELASGGNNYVYQGIPFPNQINVVSAYLRADSATTIGFSMGGSTPNTVNLTTTWQLFTFSSADTSGGIIFDNYFGPSPTQQAKTFYIWHPQLNIGSTAKPYFPTTDRLNVPRLTYQNGGGGCPSLLLEKQSTNLVTYSEQFDDASWSLGNSSITANATTSPDGTQNAEKLYTNTATSTHQIRKTISSVTAQNYTMSIFAKKGELNYIRFWEDGQTGKQCYFNLNTGVATNVDMTSASIENMGNGWYRCSAVIAIPASGVFGYRVLLTPDGTTTSFTGNGSDGVFLYGAQLEASSYPTSYIPTTSSSATRVADLSTNDTIQTAQTFAGDFTMFADFVPFIDSTDANGMMVIGGGTSGLGSTYKSYLWFSGSNVYLSGDGEVVIIQRGYSMVVNQRVKIAITRVGTTVKMFVNGAQVGASATSSLSITIRSIGWSYNLPTYQTRGKINQILLSATGASDADAISLTTI